MRCLPAALLAAVLTVLPHAARARPAAVAPGVPVTEDTTSTVARRGTSDATDASREPADEVAGLAALLERAWAIAGLEPRDRARAREIDARDLATRGAFAGPPTIGLDVRRDLPAWAGPDGGGAASARGTNEVEPGVSVPLWLPGQRDAQRRVIERERDRLAASVRGARLRIAGEVREAAWALAVAEAERRVQHARQASAVALEDDVARRVVAGELAPVDRLAARAESLVASDAVREADARRRTAGARLRALAGTARVVAPDEAPAVDADPDAHPEVVAARLAVELARARVDAARATRRDNPTVSAVARFERDAHGADYRNTIRVGIAVPLDTEARNAPRLAAAGVELAEAELALRAARRERDAAIERARIGLEAARAGLATVGERLEATRAVQSAIERAFRAGERGLPELLRARAQALEAELDGALARARHGLAIARLNQALGNEP